MKWMKDPLWIFLICGVLIFFVADEIDNDGIPYEIEIREADANRLAEQWTMQMRRPPSESELAGLLDQYLKEEIYYREARRRQLDTNDTIVRRRMVQKLTFLTEDIASAVPQEEADLQNFYNANIEDYRQPEKFTFRHRYFSVDRREDAKGDATVALKDETIPGDPFMLQKSYANRSAREIGDLFGSQFATQVSQLDPAEHWQGPIKSAFGWHGIYLSQRQESYIEPFSAVRDRVLVDAQTEARRIANADYYETLKQAYDISYPQSLKRFADAVATDTPSEN